jgi:ubiquinone biosynthesis protein COQ9
MSPSLPDETALLHLFLAALPEKGFSWETLLEAAPSLGVAITYIPSGQAGLYDFVKQGCVNAVTQQSAEIAAAPRTRDRVITGAMAFFRLFAGAPGSLSVIMTAKPLAFSGLLWAVADEIWHHAGDTATDYNYYTKRGLLSQILFHTALFMKGSKDYDPQALRAFLGRDVGRVFAVMRPVTSLKTAFSKRFSAQKSPRKF